jgi:hypothetical protein
VASVSAETVSLALADGDQATERRLVDSSAPAAWFAPEHGMCSAEVMPRMCLAAATPCLTAQERAVAARHHRRCHPTRSSGEAAEEASVSAKSASLAE